MLSQSDFDALFDAAIAAPGVAVGSAPVAATRAAPRPVDDVAAAQAARAHVRKAVVSSLPPSWRAAPPVHAALRSQEFASLVAALSGRICECARQGARNEVLPPLRTLWAGLPASPPDVRVLLVAPYPLQDPEFSTGVALGASTDEGRAPSMVYFNGRARAAWVAAHGTAAAHEAALPPFDASLRRWVAQGVALLHLVPTTEAWAREVAPRDVHESLGWAPFVTALLESAAEAAAAGASSATAHPPPLPSTAPSPPRKQDVLAALARRAARQLDDVDALTRPTSKSAAVADGGGAARPPRVVVVALGARVSRFIKSLPALRDAPIVACAESGSGAQGMVLTGSFVGAHEVRLPFWDEAAMELVNQHLARLGHQRIAW